MGGFLLHLMGFCLGAFMLLVGSATVAPSGSGVRGGAAVIVDGTNPIATTDEDFVCATLDWWPPEKCDYGTCAWGLSSLLNLDISNNILLNAIKEFSPLKIRLGGTLQDKVIYDTGMPQQNCPHFTKNTSELLGFSNGCLPMQRWDELNDFFKKAGAKIYFGLNALYGRIPMSDGSYGGSWDSSNAASLIRYTVNKGYTIHGWELGNELSGSGVGTRVDADQYAADVTNLKFLVNTLYQGFETKPLVLAPGGFFDASWFTELVSKTKPSPLDVLTHHIYNLGPGVDTHLIDKILDPNYLDGIANTFSNLQSIIKNGGTPAVAWVGEAGGAYNSGRHLVSDSFIFSFWYLDQLGMSAKYDTKTYCRQSLVGGNYGLLNRTTFAPNPDYYSALLWHRLMGKNVLSTNFTGTNSIRAYAHCAKGSEGITLLLINLSGNTTSQVAVSTNNKMYKTLKQHERHSTKKLNHLRGFGKKAMGFTREEYHLTPKDGNIQSQTMLLNNKILELDSSGNIPKLEPIEVEATQPITVVPYSIVFVHIPYFYAPACR
ncbi:Heparanase-like protein 3 [Rhynchospora pubera]|uniref:Heparanase-like protein 3 n=1 Tax=Rhynchospora pubera TaxID=906938 RepID=A0AAV8HFI6_9POAL|nr:Heparanase-like protein 3 [Rhynchospora pubera]